MYLYLQTAFSESFRQTVSIEKYSSIVRLPIHYSDLKPEVNPKMY